MGHPQTRELRIEQYHAPTPLSHSTARTITTQTIHQLLVSDRPPVLVDVLGGGEHETIPGALWLKGAGTGKHLHDSIQKKFAERLEVFTQGDKARTVIFFCLSAECWLSHNAALRATALGYANILWYRGGIECQRRREYVPARRRKIAPRASAVACPGSPQEGPARGAKRPPRGWRRPARGRSLWAHGGKRGVIRTGVVGIGSA